MGFQEFKSDNCKNSGGEGEKRMRRTSVENALQVLKLFSMDEPELSVSAVAKKLHVAKSTAYRLLASLAEEEFVYKDTHSNLYSLGASVLPMMEVVRSQIHISNEVRPILSDLVINTNENAHLGILDGLHVVYLETVEGMFDPEDYIHIGKRKPAHCTSGGKAILAFNDDIADFAAQNLQSYTPFTVTNPQQFKKQLQQIREVGHVVSKQEYRPHIIAIAVPVYNERYEVIASISITIYKKRYSRRLKNRYVIELKNAAEKLSHIITLRKRRSDTHV